MESHNKLTKRLSILRELRSVTETMRALSAVNIRRYESAAFAVSEHDNVVELGFRSLAINTGMPILKSARSIKDPAHLVIVFGTDHGLCGRFNERVLERTHTQTLTRSDGISTTLGSLLSNSETSHRCRLLIAGQIASDVSTAAGIEAHATFALPGIVDGIPTLVHSLIMQIDEWMHHHPDTRLHVFHHHSTPDNGIEIHHTVLLPVQRLRATTSREWPTHNLPGITLPPQTLLAALLKQHIFVGLYRACAESQSAEHLSRLTSMQAASRNIDEQLNSVSQKLRKQRQMAITSELLDTVSGYESIMRD